MNLIISGLIMGLGFVFIEHKYFFVFSLCFAAAGINMALTNLVPMRYGGVANDGYNVLTLIKNPSARRALSVQLAANEATAYGKRLSSLPEELYDIARLRLLYPEASLTQLASLTTPPLTKSGVNHRLQKILEIAEKRSITPDA